jgi:hypothetical protein
MVLPEIELGGRRISRLIRWIFHIIREHWQEGGTLGFICQTASEMRDIRANIRRVSKPCLAFKILAAGRHCSTSESLRETFRFAFQNIKPQDGFVVGMFSRAADQSYINAKLVKEFG